MEGREQKAATAKTMESLHDMILEMGDIKKNHYIYRTLTGAHSADPQCFKAVGH